MSMAIGALKPCSTPFSGTCDANGNLTLTGAVRVGLITNTAMVGTATAAVGQVSPGNPSWKLVTQNGPPIGFGTGPNTTIAPVLLGPGDQFVLTIIGCTPNAIISGQFRGVEGGNVQDVLSYTPGAQATGLSSIFAPQTQLMSYSLAAAVTSDTRSTPTVPIGAHALVVGISDSVSTRIMAQGNTTLNRYLDELINPTNTIKSLPGFNFYVPISNAFDTTFAITVAKLAGFALNVRVAVLLSTEAVYAYNSTDGRVHTIQDAPEIWRTPANMNSAEVRATIASGGTVQLIAAAASRFIYVIDLNITQFEVITNNWVRVRGGTGAPTFAIGPSGAGGNVHSSPAGLPTALGDSVLVENLDAVAHTVAVNATFAQP